MSLYEEFKILKNEEIVQRLQDMVDSNQEEHQELDFKQIESLKFLLKSTPPKEQREEKCEFAKDLSAFINATGGVIIYGIKETKDEISGQRTIVSFDDGINKADFNRNKLTDIINQIIYPQSTSLFIKEIQHPNNPDSLIIVLLIPESKHGAVQVLAEGRHNFRYYYRNITINSPMHHSLLQLVNNKLVHPDLKLKFEPETFAFFEFVNSNNPYQALFQITIPHVINVGEIPSKKTAIVVKIPEFFDNRLYSSVLKTNFQRDYTTYGYVRYTKESQYTIFPEMEFDIFLSSVLSKTICFKIECSDFFEEDKLKHKYNIIEFLLYADGAKVKSYKIIIDTKNIDSQTNTESLKIFSNNRTRFPATNYVKDFPELVRLEIGD